MPFRIKGLDHVVLRVADMDRALHFYSDVLGCPEERRVESIGLVQLRAGASLIDLLPADPAVGTQPGNMDHFCLRIEPFEPEALGTYLRGRGVEVGAPARRYGAEGHGPSLYIQDPDGNTVELKGPPDPT
jgi:glyoxylase I family protein